MDNELQRILSNDYGITVYREEMSEENLKRRGYRKATEEEAVRLNSIFQFAPQIAKDTYYADAFQKSFKNAVKGSYRVKLEPGFHLGKSHTTPGAYKGNVYDENNTLKSQADWLINDAEIKVSNIPQIAASVFNAVSFITGQYFMVEINRTLTDLKTGTQEIRQFLENDKYSTIKATIDDLYEIIDHLQFIEKNSERRSQTINKLSTIQSIFKKYITVSQGDIELIKNNARDDDKGEIIKENLKKATNVLMQYRILVGVYCQSKLLELYLNNIRDIEELSKYRNELNIRVNSYFDAYSNMVVWMNSYLNENHSLNDRSIGQILTSIGAGAVPTLLGGMWGLALAPTCYDSVDDLWNTTRRLKKDSHVEYAQRLVNSVATCHSNVKAPVMNLTRYIEATRMKIEVIKIGENIYTNLPG